IVGLARLENDGTALRSVVVDVRGDAVLRLEDIGSDELDVLADLGDRTLKDVLDLFAVLVDAVANLLSDRLDGADEVFVSGHEVGLAFHDDGSDGLAIGARGEGDDASGGRSAGSLLSGSFALLAKDLLSLVVIALSLVESALALHHRGIGLLAE